jgi:hypothetical protein
LTRIRLTALALLLSGLVSASFTASASAARGLALGINDPLYTDSDAGIRALWLDRTASAGASLVLIGAPWDQIAPKSVPAGFDPRNPADPAYNWGVLDEAVREATARRLSVAILVTAAPAWAQGADRPADAKGSWKPNPAAVGDFGAAIATRYSGSFAGLPRVRLWQFWAEPNLSINLAPQWQDGQPFAAQHYRLMLNAFYDQVHAVRGDNVVLTGGTAPYGDDPGGQRTRPVAFWRTLLCVEPTQPKRGKKGRQGGSGLRGAACPVKPKLDVLAHNAITTSGGPTTPAISPDDAGSADLDRIVRVLRAAEAAGNVVPGGRHQIWTTEMWWESNPPNPVGSPLGVQAREIEQEMFLLWKAGSSVVVNLRIRDSSEVIGRLGGFNSGLYFADGTAKPALTAYRFPFVTERVGKGLLRAWGRSPAAGRLLIQMRRRGRWITARKLQVGQGAVFVAKLRARGKQALRASVAGTQSLVWKQP